MITLYMYLDRIMKLEEREQDGQDDKAKAALEFAILQSCSAQYIITHSLYEIQITSTYHVFIYTHYKALFIYL